eukprot:TRINITY_DN1808_c0_g1_i1.p2 TRINITY_DN1808_c0_g1~~TRINITY_DN1808_c0_g1_i1.p2  ORF type:complete len:123 (+),score=18.35 TRINITY_DN1808_c0_g1_i1:237-605(+)
MLKMVELKRKVQARTAYRNMIDARFAELTKRIALDSNQYPALDTSVAYWMTLKAKLSTPEQWQCLRDTYKAYEQLCEAFEDYSWQYVRVFYNLCSKIAVDSSQTITQGIMVVCEKRSFVDEL